MIVEYTSETAIVEPPANQGILHPPNLIMSNNHNILESCRNPSSAKRRDLMRTSENVTKDNITYCQIFRRGPTVYV